jgi:hypothetical protein
MSNWKRALMFGSLGVGAFFLLTGRRHAGVAVATIGAAVLAAEYPEKFEEIWRNAPAYLAKGNQLVATISQVAERISEQRERGRWRQAMAER